MEERKKKIYTKLRKEIKDRGKIVEFFSHTKIDNYNQCNLSYKYKYIDKIKSDFKDNIYTDIGTLCHDLIEKYLSYNDVTKEDILNEYIIQSQHFAELNGVDSNFNLIVSMEHYFKNSTFLEQKKESNLKKEFEVPLYTKLKDTDEKEYWYIGFIDMVEHNDDGTVTIYDFKTSHRSGYTGKKLEKASIQLYTYAYLYENIYHKKVREIKYVFLKFCDITFLDFKGKKRKTSNLERCKIGDELSKKEGDSILEIQDNILDLECNDEIKLRYMRSFVSTFVEILNKRIFDSKNKDDSYCLKFCEYRKSGHCKAYDEEDNSSMNVLLEMFKYKCKQGDTNDKK